MKTFLFGWSPDQIETWSARESTLAAWRAEGQASGYYSSRSSKPRTGDRFVVIRQGGVERAKRGVISLGRITSNAVKVPHWDPTKRAKGGTTHRVGVLHLAMWEEPVLTLPELEAAQPQVKNWSPLSSGEELLPEAADWLFGALGVHS